MTRSLGIALLAVAMLAGVRSAVAENWPQWRGPSLNGVSGERNLPVKWSTTENVSWKLQLPAWSGSTPIVWGDRIFLNVADDLRVQSGDNLHLWCVDRVKGTMLWKRPLGSGNHQERKQNMSTPSPVTDGTLVWVMTGTGVLKAFDFNGAEKWTRDIPKDYGRFGLNWGYGSSPLLFHDALYVQVLHGMKTDDPSNGKELWRANGLNPDNDGSYRIVASPVVQGELIVAPSRERPMLVLKAGGRGDVTKSHVLWSFGSGPDVPTPVTDGTYLYVVNDRGIMFCLDLKTGKEHYGRQRLRPGTYSGSPVLADGKIYITNEDGLTSVIKAGPAFELLAENDFDDYTLSSPAVSEGQIFFRTRNFLFAIGQRAPARSE